MTLLRRHNEISIKLGGEFWLHERPFIILSYCFSFLMSLLLMLQLLVIICTACYIPSSTDNTIQETKIYVICGIYTLIYTHNAYILSQTIENLQMARDTLIFLFHHLGIVINLRKFALTPKQINGVLRTNNRFQNYDIDLTRGKVQKITKQCEKLIANPQTSVRQVLSGPFVQQFKLFYQSTCR